jgi:hypothetical protein
MATSYRFYCRIGPLLANNGSGGTAMSQSRTAQPEARQKHPDEWRHAARQLTAFHLKKRGHELRGLDDDDLKQVPIVPAGTRLQQGGTYVNLTERSPHEFTATGNLRARAGDAYAPKDQVPYEVWNRLIAEPKPGPA